MLHFNRSSTFRSLEADYGFLWINSLLEAGLLLHGVSNRGSAYRKKSQKVGRLFEGLRYYKFLLLYFKKLFKKVSAVCLFVCLFAGSVKDSGNIFMQSFPLYTPHLFSMLSNGDIVDIENPDEIFSPTFAVDKSSRLLLHLSIFLNKHSRSA